MIKNQKWGKCKGVLVNSATPVIAGVNALEGMRARGQEGKGVNVKDTLADSSAPVITSGGKCLVGFTLAEVLITLTIVGVVAAMTIPSLMSNISERVKNHQIEVFKAKLHKGCSLMCFY